MKWIRVDPNSITVIRCTSDGYTLERTSRTGKNQYGPKIIAPKMARRLLWIPQAFGFRFVVDAHRC